MSTVRFYFPLLFASLIAFSSISAEDPKDPKEELLGVWQAISIEKGGETAPPDATKQMRFTFRKDELLVKGNFKDDKEESCKYKIDAKKSPRHFQFLPPDQEIPIIGIYRIEKGKLEICARQAKEEDERPKKFETTKGDGYLLVKFERVEE